MSVAVKESASSEQEVGAWEVLREDLHERDTSTTSNEHRRVSLAKHSLVCFSKLGFNLFWELRGVKAVSTFSNCHLNLSIVGLVISLLIEDLTHDLSCLS